MKLKYYIIISLLVLFFTASLSFPADVGDKSPSFSISTIDGNKVSTRKIKDNKHMMLVFWATWCPNCKREIPSINDIYRSLKDKNIELLAINVGVNDSIDKIKRYVKKYKINYPVAFDKDSEVSREFKISGVPTIIIVDKSGTIKYRSYRLPENLENNFHKILSKKSTGFKNL
jgi:peroxiredoxin